MSESEKNDFLKVRFVRASGKKTEFEFKKFPEKYLGLTRYQISEMEAELIYAFESALYDAKEQRKDEIIVKFNV